MNSTPSPGGSGTGDARGGGFPAWSSRGRDAPDGPEWTAWSWTSGRRGGSWLGILLVLFGVGLLVQQVNPGISLSSLILLALGLAFAAAWIVGGRRSATVPALLLLALAAAQLLVDTGTLRGSGWTPLILGATLVLAWAIGLAQRVRREWALWIGLLFAAYGLASVWAQFPTLPNWAWIWPLLLILAGVLLLFRRRAI